MTASAGVLAGCAVSDSPDDGDDDGGSGADDGAWPTFQYDETNAGYAPGAVGPERPYRERWTRSLDGAVWGSPVVANGHVYVPSYDHRLYAIDVESGGVEWRFETGDRIDSTPAVHDGTVYVGSFDRHVYAVDAATGEKRWAFDTGGFVRSSPTVVGDTVYVGGYCRHFECKHYYDPDPKRGFLYALDRETGDLRWRYRTGDGVLSTPAVVGNSVYVGSSDHGIHAIDATSGDGRWTYETDGVVMSSPSVADGTIYVGSNDANVYAIDAGTGTEEWVFETDATYIGGSPSIVDDTVYVGTGYEVVLVDPEWGDERPRGVVYALSAETGEERWSHFGEALEIGSSPAIAGGRLYVGSHSVNGGYGAVYVIDLDGTVRREYEVEGVGVGTSPAVADGTVYFATAAGVVYALE